MIRRHARTLRALLMLSDAMAALVALWFAAILRFGSGGLHDLATTLPDPVPTAITYVAGWVVLLWLQGLYRPRSRLTVRREVYDVLRATVLFGVIGLATLYVSKASEVSRVVIVILLPSLAAGALASRLAIRAILSRLRVVGRNTRYMLVVGTGVDAERFANLVESEQELGLHILGHLRENGPDPASVDRPILGNLADLETVLHANVVDEVAICLPPDHWSHVEDVARICADEGKTVRIPMVLPGRSLPIGPVEMLHGIAVYSVLRGPDHLVGLVAKRMLDVALSLVSLVVLAIPMAAIAVIIRLDSRGPACFRQTRVGLHGRTFEMVKYRTMVADAEGRLEDLRDRNVISGPAFKLDDDPRVTRMGRFLRRTSLDELPQLWNVLRGDMSIVGPRPPLPAEVAAYDIWHRRRLSMKPGMTGLWQVKGRHEPAFDRWVEIDLQYIDSWSFWLDLKIMAQTIPAMLQGR